MKFFWKRLILRNLEQIDKKSIGGIDTRACSSLAAVPHGKSEIFLVALDFVSANHPLVDLLFQETLKGPSEFSLLA
ncbi:hypothetical protein KY361_05170 [Candidatus Woesearchaeota archaeon]|nr:hypothetical protein [Candidatus Woesearchaeota archaeon]